MILSMIFVGEVCLTSLFNVLPSQLSVALVAGWESSRVTVSLPVHARSFSQPRSLQAPFSSAANQGAHWLFFLIVFKHLFLVTI